jgi:hypothetical protein
LDAFELVSQKEKKRELLHVPTREVRDFLTQAYFKLGGIKMGKITTNEGIESVKE